MRYTTTIDISEIREVYKNKNARLLYFHMALKCGYHDSDRDMLPLSIRTLADQAGITLSACRHCLKLLRRYQLVTRQGDTWIVRKWIEQQAVTTRRKSAAAERKLAAAAERELEQEQRRRAQELEELRRLNLRAQGKTSWMVYYETRQEKAAAGSEEDKAWCEKNRATYDSQARQLAEENKNRKK